MNITELILKIKRRLWSNLVKYTRRKKIYPYIYKSYWHFKFFPNATVLNRINYYTAVPNPGAGIGHQLANYISGYWFSKQFGLEFAHMPFAQEKWERFFGFGENETSAKNLINEHGFKQILLPLFDESNSDEIELIKNIIASFHGQKVVFVAEQDQSYRDQFGVINDIKNKFYHANARKKDKLIYSNEQFNIAIHVRRGDIVVGQKNKKSNLLMRWQDNEYFTKVLSALIDQFEVNKPIAIYLFSQGEVADFSIFRKFENIQFCLDMNAQDSFLHMVYADLLITSKSSFSYKPALLSNGIKVCPKDFWHGYPKCNQWILVEKDGSISKVELEKLQQFDSIIN
ncbi:MAG: hypothetical protein Q8R96_05825 [Bacteroidota bacterium]|nr:hypothetical protein [Bacteroidota bacterium]